MQTVKKMLIAFHGFGSSVSYAKHKSGKIFAYKSLGDFNAHMKAARNDNLVRLQFIFAIQAEPYFRTYSGAHQRMQFFDVDAMMSVSDMLPTKHFQ